ncbi:putative DNA helicase ino80 [Glugoides intestinalis]
MRETEYRKLRMAFERDGMFVPEPKKSYEAMMTELPTNNNEAKIFLLIKEFKMQNHTIVVQSLEGHYANIIKTIPKSFKQFYSNYQNIVSQQKKLAIICARELKRSLSKTSKTNPTLKSKRINRELNSVLKKTTREEVSKQKKEEKEEEMKRKRDEEEKEELRQKRKFNYLMSQTEAFTSFFLNKKSKVEETSENTIAIKAAQDQLTRLKEFDVGDENGDGLELNAKNEAYEHQAVQQPKLLNASLKEYQLKGLNWLVNLYNQGINGILADDMGLGKTIQSIALLCHLSEFERVSGPFLIITPSSTLHNWSTEFSRFVPSFKVLNYWGSVQERKDMRKNLKKYNVVVTSYQIAVSDELIIAKIKWQYMILDEAQAIKSINSQRWRILLGFKSRSRLLLTGTPVQNNMQELWSLLHFIMPALFDSLSEFSEWFSKDIENKSKVEEEQIAKLHTILKPFMLRRTKNDIKDELGTKEIINIMCEMSSRQRILYDEILSSKLDYDNILMQLKKVCNHPDLFEKLEPISALCISTAGENGYVGNRSYFKKFISPTALNSSICKKRNLLDFCGSLTNKEGILSFNIETNLPAVPTAAKHAAKVFNSLITSDIDKESILQDILRKRIQIESGLKRFRFVHEKVMSRQITTNIDQAFVLSENMADRLTVVPPLNTFISDSGKLSRIDLLLKDLKSEGHRVLIYFQMTRMMDLFEEYLVKREYNYLRLDGSSKINQRKELVEQWQSCEDVFIFILSTRAGGVGINLTAADTVIFYDNDWNPTVDQQAMDRVHRLGQTKNVTVYRLITANSVEEKVIERAGKKEEVQKIVIKENVFEGSYLDH